MSSGWTKTQKDGFPILAKPGPTGHISWKRILLRAKHAYWSQFSVGTRVVVHLPPPRQWSCDSRSHWFSGAVIAQDGTGVTVKLDKNPPWSGLDEIRVTKPPLAREQDQPVHPFALRDWEVQKVSFKPSDRNDYLKGWQDGWEDGGKAPGAPRSYVQGWRDGAAVKNGKDVYRKRGYYP